MTNNKSIIRFAYFVSLKYTWNCENITIFGRNDSHRVKSMKYMSFHRVKNCRRCVEIFIILSSVIPILIFINLIILNYLFIL